MDNNLNKFLIAVATDLSGEDHPTERFDHLLVRLRDVIDYDASAVLVREGDFMKIVSSRGLSAEARTRTYRLTEQPRFRIMVETGIPVVFPPDSTLGDPFDGLLQGDSNALHNVHSCLGCPLVVDNIVVGCLTFDALRLHAFDSLPPEFLETLGALAGASLRTALLLQRLERESSLHMEWARELQGLQIAREMIGDSLPMQRLRQEIHLVAKSPFPVLILGETGTGKELVARLVHKQSARENGPWVTVNCASMPESLAESELFGHVRGAFTGADRDRLGKFELAHKGTLFLDEIGDLHLNLQAKLLRVLQEGELQQLGSDSLRQIDVRIVAATHRDLEAMVNQGTFRRDLLHRLHVFPLHIAPLRNRSEDIPLLVAACAQETSRELGYGLVRFSSSVLEIWQKEFWPGNVRELQNRVRSTLLSMRLQSGENALVKDADVSHFQKSQLENAVLENPTEADISSREISFAVAVDNFKRDLIRKAVLKSHGSWSKAAETLQMDRANLHRMGRRLNLLQEKPL